MRSCLFSTLAFAGLSVAQHVHIYIPEVESYIASVQSEFASYTHGPRPETRTGASASTSTSTNTRVSTSTAAASSSTSGPSVSELVASSSSCSFWMENIAHQGIAAFNANPSTYTVFRNVKNYGAKGDGITDDTAAINRAISSGGRCAPGSCQSSSTSPAVVYFPAGTYVISSSIIDYYYTQIIGNANCPPTIKASKNFTGAHGLGLIDGDPYGSSGNLDYGATNIFWRSIRNFVIDMTAIPANESATGIHWPTAQATSLQFITFKMSQAANTQHQAVFIESGSGGFMSDLVFYGGLNGINVGNQQFTMVNLTFYNAKTAINQLWDWGWLYQGIHINNCSVGLYMASGGVTAQSVGSITMIDSSITNTPVGIVTAHNSVSQPPTAGSLVLENVVLNNVPVAVQGPGGATVLAGSSGSKTIAAWAEGHRYNPTGPTNIEQTINANSRPASLLSGSNYYYRSRPQYQTLPISSFVSARSSGAKGNGVTDDTAALQSAITSAASAGKVLFLDQGDYLVTKTLVIPPGSKIVGESYSVILSSGSFFSNINSPQPVLQIGSPGQSGAVELSDMIVSTQGAQAGAVLIQYNLASSSTTPSGLWDVHTRIGGFAGSKLQVAQCPTTPSTLTPPAAVNSACIAAYMSLHLTPQSTGFFALGSWLWTADHDVDDPNLTQITIYTGRGLLDQSTGPVWLIGTAVEHHSKYQYQFASASNVFAGFIQTETAYYQPNPPASIPFPTNSSLADPVFATVTTATNLTASNSSIPSQNGWGLRVYDSTNVLVYGAGLYSFFDNYNVTCSDQGDGEVCQNHIVDVEGSKGVTIYNLNTVGAHYMVDYNGVDSLFYGDNEDGFVETVVMFRTT